MTTSEPDSPSRMTADEFASLVTHELRNPLNALSGWLHLLSADPALAGDPAKRALGGMRRALDQQLSLIETLGKVLRQSGGASSGVATSAVDPCALLDEVAEAMAEAARTAGRTIEVRRGDAPCAPVAGDAPTMARAIQSMVAYAMRHGVPGAPVVLACDAVEGGTRLRVEVDEGGGEGLSIWHGFGGRRARLGLELLHAALVMESCGARVGPASDGRVGDVLEIRFDAPGADARGALTREGGTRA